MVANKSTGVECKNEVNVDSIESRNCADFGPQPQVQRDEK